MRKAFVAGIAVLFVTGSAFGQCHKSGKGKVVKAGDSLAKEYKCCPTALKGQVASVMEKLPQMTYQVGDFKTPCEKTATSKVSDGSKMMYLVADKSYEGKTDAVVALTGLLNKEVENMKTIQFAVGDKTYHCPVTAKSSAKEGQQMKYQLAGITFDSEDKAKEALELIQTKMKTKKATVAGASSDCAKACSKGIKQVAGKKAGCDKSSKKLAGSTAKATGEKKAVACDKGSKTNADCCNKAQDQLASVTEEIREMVQSAASVALSASS